MNKAGKQAANDHDDPVVYKKALHSHVRLKDYSMTDVGVNIRRVRRERGISVEQLREHLMLESTQSVYRWERGETMPQADTLIALCVFPVRSCVYYGGSYKKEIERKSA